MCLAGQERNQQQDLEGIPFEDFSAQPGWARTQHQTLPWVATPAMLQYVPVDRTCIAQFFETDIWHNMHLGCLKHWLGSSFVSLVELLDGGVLQGSVDAKFSWLTTDFKSFCRTKKLSPHMSEISRASMNFPSSTACPLGQWSKGVVSTHFCQYLEDFCDRYVMGRTADECLLSIVTLAVLYHFPQT